jgi:hypothetical protein
MLPATSQPSAGTGTATTGNITASAFADLTAAPETGHITLTAGSAAGNLTLTSATLTAGDTITLQAPAGSLSHGTGGYLDAPVVAASALLGISGRTRAANVTAHSGEAGNILIHSLTDVRIEASTPDGSIEVTATGDLHAASILAGGSSPANAVRLIAQPAGDTPSSLIVGQLTSVPAADLAAHGRRFHHLGDSAGRHRPGPAGRHCNHRCQHSANFGCQHQPHPCHHP